MPSNGTIVNVVHHDLDLYFQGHNISGNHIIVNIWKMVRASEKCSSTSFIEVGTGYRMVPLQILCIVTLTSIIQGHKISGNIIIFYIWKTVRASKKCSSTIFIKVDTSHRMVPLQILCIVTLTSILQGHKISGNNIIFNIWNTVIASEKCSDTTFIEIAIKRHKSCLSHYFDLNFQSQKFKN